MSRIAVRAIACALLALCTVSASVATAVERGAPKLPFFAVDHAWPEVPAKWKLGDVSAVAVDAKDNVWVLQRPRTLKGDDIKRAAPPVMVFDGAGHFIKAWGGEGTGYEWPQREHGLYIDSKGFVWISGNNCPGNNLPNLKPVADDQILKFTNDGTFVLQIGHSNQSKGNADTANVHRAADFVVYPQTNELFVADGYGNHRVIVYDADTGAYKRMWGAFGNTPKDDDHCQVVYPTSFSDPGPDNFDLVHSIKIANDSTVYVADHTNRRVQMFTKDGKFLKQMEPIDVPFARSLAFSPDQRLLYVGEGKDIAILEPKSLKILGAIKPDGLIRDGHEMAVDSKGNIYLALLRDRLQKLAFKGMGK